MYYGIFQLLKKNDLFPNKIGGIYEIDVVM